MEKFSFVGSIFFGLEFSISGTTSNSRAASDNFPRLVPTPTRNLSEIWECCSLVPRRSHVVETG